MLRDERTQDLEWNGAIATTKTLKLDFDVEACRAAALRVNPDLPILIVSARTGAGIDAFAAWIEARAALVGKRR